jgi:hypothetical protein
VIENLGFARLGLWNEAFIENVEDIFANILELRFNLLAIIANGRDVLIRALGLLLLLNRGDYTPRSTTSANHVLVGDREQITLIDSQFAANLTRVSGEQEKLLLQRKEFRELAVSDTDLGNFLDDVSKNSTQSGTEKSPTFI